MTHPSVSGPPGVATNTRLHCFEDVAVGVDQFGQLRSPTIGERNQGDAEATSTWEIVQRNREAVPVIRRDAHGGSSSVRGDHIEGTTAGELLACRANY
jgi:hypothetical protein